VADQYITPAKARSRAGMAKILALLVAAFLCLHALTYIVDIYILNILTRALLLAVLAVTVDLLWGYTGILTFGHATYFGIGAYVCALMFGHFGLAGPWPLVALVLAIGGSMLVAAIVSWLSFYHGASPLYASIVSLALPIVAVQIIFAGGNFTGSSSGLSGFETYDWEIESWFVLAGLLLTVVLIGARLFVGSDYGRILVAIRENEDRCSYLGIPVSRLKIGLTVACAGVAAVAGFIYAAFSNVVAPELAGFLLGTELLIWVALGGRGTLLGPALGTVTIDVTSSYLSGSLPYLWKLLVGIAFVAVIILLPQGLARIAQDLAQKVRRRPAVKAGEEGRIAQMTAAPVPPAQEHTALAVDRLSRSYGSLSVLRDISFKVAAGELMSIVGPNGAGKTTLMRCISNGSERSAGDVIVGGHSIGRKSPNEIVALGVGRSFQNTTLFDSLTVIDCLFLARYRKVGAQRAARTQVVELPAAAYQIVTATGLGGMLDAEVKNLAHGKKRALELAMALATEPSVLLLDEPTAGLTKTERSAIGKVLMDLVSTTGLAIILIEHDLDFVREVSSRILVLHQGSVLLDGSVEEVVSSALVKQVYSGEGAGEH
jgi:branched-chain amino acid transport system permease protein